MIELKSQADFRTVRRLPFCYLCGKQFTGKTDKTRDHIPPKNIFPKEDREPPLILPAHETCNGGQSDYDETIGQLVMALHGKVPTNQKLELTVIDSDTSTKPYLALTGINLQNVVWRWIRAFHSSLYQEYLPDDIGRAIHLPFPSGTIEGDVIQMEEHPFQHRVLVTVIKKNRTTNNIDRIESNNGQCIYECVWEQHDDGSIMCVFALRISEWKKLGEERLGERGCVGLYITPNDPPASASKGTGIFLFPWIAIRLVLRKSDAT